MTNLPCRFLPAAILACALLAGACGPINPLSRPAPREWTAESPPGEVARWVERVCRGPFEDGLCVERNLVALVGQAGIGHAMEVLGDLAG